MERSAVSLNIQTLTSILCFCQIFSELAKIRAAVEPGAGGGGDAHALPPGGAAPRPARVPLPAPGMALLLHYAQNLSYPELWTV